MTDESLKLLTGSRVDFKIEQLQNNPFSLLDSVLLGVNFCSSNSSGVIKTILRIK